MANARVHLGWGSFKDGHKRVTRESGRTAAIPWWYITIYQRYGWVKLLGFPPACLNRCVRKASCIFHRAPLPPLYDRSPATTYIRFVPVSADNSSTLSWSELLVDVQWKELITFPPLATRHSASVRRTSSTVFHHPRGLIYGGRIAVLGNLKIGKVWLRWSRGFATGIIYDLSSTNRTLILEMDLMYRLK